MIASKLERSAFVRLERVDRPLLEGDERIALGALGDRVGAQLDAVQLAEVVPQAREHRPEAAADVEDARRGCAACYRIASTYRS